MANPERVQLSCDKVIGMKPGRELDALIAEKVMGVIVCKCDEPHNQWATPHSVCGGVCCVPSYSTDIAAAWEVVNQVRKTSYLDVLSLTGPSDETKDWWATFEKKWAGRVYETMWDWEHGESAPHAICLAALKAMGVEI